MFASVVIAVLGCIVFATIGNCDPPTKPQCKDNEEYVECSVPCIPTCRVLNMPLCHPAECIPACQCKWGYALNDDGNCVLPSECPDSFKACSEQEIPVQCRNPCPATCENPNPPLCKAKCIQGCNCKGDLVRDAQNKCIPLEECPKQINSTQS